VNHGWAIAGYEPPSRTQNQLTSIWVLESPPQAHWTYSIVVVRAEALRLMV
jgi:hypothetical protein